MLPKFKVALELSGKDQQAGHGYRPGDHVTGTVRANYFFGKSVDGGEVTVKASGMDVGVSKFAAASGKTDGEGAWHFDLQLPNYFAGRPLNQGAARVLVEATVKDSAGHSETRGEPITVSESPILITAVPEGGTLVPHLENQVFILTSYADGQPASTHITVQAGTIRCHDGCRRRCDVSHQARQPGSETLEVEARDQAGQPCRRLVHLNSAQRRRPDPAAHRTRRLSRRRPHPSPSFLHAPARHRLCRCREGRADRPHARSRSRQRPGGVDRQPPRPISPAPSIATPTCSARTRSPIGDHRLVFVQPADELKIEATADAAVYKPGDDARIRFRVTNSRGEGVHAALGLQIVDEAVFALAEKQPGFAKVFFYLEQEVMKPRYEIHSIGMPEVFDHCRRVARSRRRARCSPLPRWPATNQFDNEVGRTPAADAVRRVLQPLLSAFRSRQPNWPTASAALTIEIRGGDLTKCSRSCARSGDPLTRDAWGTDLRADRPWLGASTLPADAAPVPTSISIASTICRRICRCVPQRSWPPR